MDDIQTVEITKRPGQSLGFYIREGNGRDRGDGVFISRLAVGGVVDLNGLLHVGDEIVSVNTLPVLGRRLEDVVISMSVARRLVLTVRPATVLTSGCSETNSSSSLSALAAADDDDASGANPVVILRGGFRNQNQAQGQCQTQADAGFTYQSDSNDQLERSRQWNNSIQSEATRMSGRSAMRYQGPDDSVDSGLSSDNSGFYKLNNAGPVTWSNECQQMQQLSMSAFQPSPTSNVFCPNGLRAQHPGYFSDSEAEYSPAYRHIAAAGRSIGTMGPRMSTWQGNQQPPEWTERFIINGGGPARARQSMYSAPPCDYSTLAGIGHQSGLRTNSHINGIKYGVNSAEEIENGMKNENRRLSARDR